LLLLLLLAPPNPSRSALQDVQAARRRGGGGGGGLGFHGAGVDGGFHRQRQQCFGEGNGDGNWWLKGIWNLGWVVVSSFKYFLFSPRNLGKMNPF